MDKVYIQVQELLIEHGADLNKLMDSVKSGKLALYTMPRLGEYEAISKFDCYVDDYLTNESNRIENEYTECINSVNEFNATVSSCNGYIDKILLEQEIDRRINSCKRIYNDKCQPFADKARLEKELVKRLYVKSCDYENVANSDNSPRQKREAPEIRIKETLEACQFVEKAHGLALLNKPKPDVRTLVKTEMRFKEPYTPTFNEWYRNCPFTRGRGNPNLGKKSA